MNGRSKRAQQRIDKITKYARKDREATRHDKKIARNEHDTKEKNNRDGIEQELASKKQQKGLAKDT